MKSNSSISLSCFHVVQTDYHESASDRKFLASPFASLYPASYLTVEKITAEDMGQGKWLLVIPVMGLSAHIGTVVMDYQVPPATVTQ